MLRGLNSSPVEGGWEREGVLGGEQMITRRVPAAGLLAAALRALLKGEVTMPSEVPAAEPGARPKLFHLKLVFTLRVTQIAGEASCNWKGLEAFCHKAFCTGCCQRRHLTGWTAIPASIARVVMKLVYSIGWHLTAELLVKYFQEGRGL